VADWKRTPKVIHIKREQGEGNWFYATSPDLRGLLVADATPEGLEKMIPQAIANLYGAREIEISVIPLDDGDEGPHGAWVAVPVELMGNHYMKPDYMKA